MTHQIVQFQEIDNLQIDHLVLDHLQFHVNHVNILVVNTIFVTESSIPLELHHFQVILNILNVITNK